MILEHSLLTEAFELYFTLKRKAASIPWDPTQTEPILDIQLISGALTNTVTQFSEHIRDKRNVIFGREDL